MFILSHILYVLVQLVNMFVLFLLHCTTVFGGTGERNGGYALLVMVNKPKTALYRAPTFSLLIASNSGTVAHVDSHYTSTVLVYYTVLHIHTIPVQG